MSVSLPFANDVDIGGLPVSERNPAPSQVVGRELYLNLVSWSDADVVHSHLAGNVGKHLVSVFEFDTEHGIRQRLNDRAFNQNCVVLGLGQGAHHLDKIRVTKIKYSHSSARRST